MVSANTDDDAGRSPRNPLEYFPGDRGLHDSVLMLARFQLRIEFPDVAGEPRNLSRYEGSADIEIDYPAQASLVTDFLVARDEKHAAINVWDVWPANASVAPPKIHEAVFHQIAVLTRGHELMRLQSGPSPDPAVWYFPATSLGLGGYWISVFGVEDWAQYGPADREPFDDCPGFVFYLAAFDRRPAPFQIDNLFPAPIRVPALGVYPPPAS